MSLQTFVLLVIIGVASGLLSGFVGVGGGIIIVPALIYFLSMPQHAAQGTSLFILLLPVGFMAVYNYYKAGSINWNFGIVIAIAFVVGGYFGSKLSLKMSPGLVRFVFGIIMVIISFKLITSGYTAWNNERA
ncbi:MAG: sulfite exporter TauE/SafE family protein [Bacteroidetes bacterium]|nr:sulfite exporter TauE/SafE family protein [Bacteroidota bacterium]